MGYKQAIAVRDDLDLSEGKLAVQVAHGAVEAACKARRDHQGWFDAWRSEGQVKVCVRVDDEATLRELQTLAGDLPSHLVQDAGRTEIPAGTATALAIGPAPEGDVDRITGDLPLL